MLEILICSLVTVLPDYLYRRFAQDKRWGREITFTSMWYELRYGITGCLLLTVTLITLVFYWHPAASSASLFFRTVTVLPQSSGRVAEVHVRNGEVVEAGAPIFTFDDAVERARLDAARERVAEANAARSVSQARLEAASAQVAEAEAALRQAEADLARSRELEARNSAAVSAREVERQQALADVRRGGLQAAQAARAAAEAEVRTLLPAQIAAAEAARAEAEVQLARTVVRAGVAGRLEQFTLRPGDFVSTVMRPAGVLVPLGSGRRQAEAGFGQLAAQVIKPGTLVELSCASRAFTIVPTVVVDVQEVIAAGQVRPSDQLLDISNLGPPGTITVYLEPLWEGGFARIPPGSRCVAFAYTTAAQVLADEPDASALRHLFLHVVETVGVVHAAMLRIHTLTFPLRTLVLGGH